MDFSKDASHSECQMCSVSVLTELTVSGNGVIISNDVTHEVAWRRNSVPLQQLMLVNGGWSSTTDQFKNK